MELRDQRTPGRLVRAVGMFVEKGFWQEGAVIVLGIWLLVAPGTLSYDIPIVTWNNVAVGLAATILALSRIEDKWKYLTGQPPRPL